MNSLTDQSKWTAHMSTSTVRVTLDSWRNLLKVILIPPNPIFAPRKCPDCQQYSLTYDWLRNGWVCQVYNGFIPVGDMP